MSSTPPVVRDSYDRIVPDNLIARFRNAPKAVCPLCEGDGRRQDGKSFKVCHVCEGHGCLTSERLKLISPEYLEICKGFRCLPVEEPEPIPQNGTHKRTRKVVES